MTIVAIFQISMEIWGIIICMIALVGILVARTMFGNGQNLKLLMEFLCILLLINDVLAWIFRGRPGEMAGWITQISNFMVFCVNYVIMSVAAVFIWRSIGVSGRKPRRIYAVFGLSILGILLLIVSQFNQMFYYFDVHNIYHRGKYFLITQIIAIVGMSLIMTVLIQYRKFLENSVFWAMLSYFILPAAATITLMLYYGLSLQNMAIVISTQIMFIVDIIQMANRLNRSQSDYQKARMEAEHDAMTGLWNKTFGMAYITDYMDKMQEGDSAALFFADIDSFKNVNDTYGHMVGDYWIKEVANILESVFRREDIVCRFGGDEYLILLKGMCREEVLREKILQFEKILERKSLEQGQRIRCSFGICRIMGKGCQIDRCIDLADRALYEAKQEKTSSVVIYQMTDSGE
ncbi:MAG: GGDEF domain-containing protein [Anaerobutyricum sp.]|nr:GGDEF domain-containing protein [Anaerobutyricum sp.]